MLSADDIVDILSIKLIGMVPDEEAVLIASNKGVPDPNSRAGQAFRNIARRLMGEEVPFYEIQDSGGILTRLKRLFSSS